MKGYFDYLDKDKGGSISAEELEEPLIALGFAENRADVQKLIDAIDKNSNGDVDIDEFFAIIKSGKVKMTPYLNSKALVVHQLVHSLKRWLNCN